MNAQPVRQLHAGPAEYLWLSTSLGVTSEAVPDLPFCASVACAAPSVDSHQDLPKGGHEVGRVAITDNDRGSLAVAPPVSSLPTMNCEQRGEMRRHLCAYLPVRLAVGGGLPGRGCAGTGALNVSHPRRARRRLPGLSLTPVRV